MELLSAKNLSHRYDLQSDWLFHDLSFELEKGKTLSVIGPSGSGKTTLINLLSGMFPAAEGQVRFEGKEFSSMNAKELRELHRNKIAFVFQESMLLEEYTLEENCLLPALLAKVNPDQRKLGELFEILGLTDRAGAFPTQSSGGEKQRAAIARALLGGPSVVFADEPTGSLDEKNADQVSSLLFETCRQNGSALVLVTHDLILASRTERQIALKKHRTALE